MVIELITYFLPTTEVFMIIERSDLKEALVPSLAVPKTSG
jgi:hypothetical protein